MNQPLISFNFLTITTLILKITVTKLMNFILILIIPPNQTRVKVKLLVLFYNIKFSLFFLFPLAPTQQYQPFLYLAYF